ncbi:MAG: serine--tRNA ligase [Gammaproteobacteria bacterium]|nr:serine--tRNA ligase [Gammaproteobacteria bacterium]
MIDPQTLRRDLQGVADRLRRRGFDLDIAGFERLEARRRSAQDETERLRHERRTSSKRIGAAKAAGEDIEPLVRAVGDLGDRLTVVAREFDAVREQLDEFVLAIPNPPHDTVPAGTDETDNVELRSWGEIMEFNFEPRDHVQLAAEYLDLESAAKVAGSRFSVLRGPLARLHRALTQFMIDVHTGEHGYEEVYVPYLVHRSALEGTGQLPKFEADLFAVDGERDRFLIPTAEVPVTNLMRDRILDADDLPLRFVAHTPCFRSEAGNYGKDTHGIFRQHQFEKVELVQIVRPEASWEALDELTAHAETILRRLELPYRAVVLCAGDLGFAAAKTIDLEVWLPGERRYREISSCSNFLDFQARRMLARFRNPDTGRPDFVHTINGSGLAVGRTLIALLENFQDGDGVIHIPDALRSYMGGVDRLAFQAT